MYIGFFNVNKPKGMTSAAVVGRLKRILNQKGLGHMGTLDPMAEGVLPIAAGRPATRMFDALRAKKKEYVAEFTFGISTDTLDTTGQITQSGGRIPAKTEIEAALPSFIGRISQLPPDYSAKSVNGARAYDLARRGQETNLKPVEIDVYEYELLCPANAAPEGIGVCEYELPSAANAAPDSAGGSAARRGAYTFRVLCGGGTYIRALARDLGAALGTHCVMSALTRTRSGCFHIGDARTLDEIAAAPAAALVSVEWVAEAIRE
ncbi:MAG: tRNA pseudouridine(55) synthase TruB [Clostridiales bacterium]|jgi:tRNA pseudouridine(55) synthase|nr:tRNA pseudouridine(55) synthase TruB [Clostridiales bacterium]